MSRLKYPLPRHANNAMLLRDTFLIVSFLVHWTFGAEEYQGLYVGKLNTYAHQVTGDVYAVDEHTFLIKNFFYDGLGQDAYFWAGATVRPSNVGFIVPDENGRTNKLKQYVNRDITIKISENKKITSLKWLAVWDVRDSRNFADIYIPSDFQPPSPQRISEFSQLSNNVKSGPIVILDSKTIKIPEFHFDGQSGNAYFFVGTGPQANPTGKKIPDERGYLDPLGSYEEEDLVLELPGNTTVFDIDWLAVWDDQLQENFGSVLVPDSLNIPPSLVNVIKTQSRLPHCEQLHKRLQINWEIFGPQITIELIGQIDLNDYIAFGISGSETSSQMLGSDVAVSYLIGHLGVTSDYNITGKFPCTSILDHNSGVCLDTRVGGVENYQIHTFLREDSLTRITYRRNLINTGDEGDKVYNKEGDSYIVWAIGKLNAQKEPRFHHIYPRGNTKIHFGRRPAQKNCFLFVSSNQNSFSNAKIKPWGPLKIFNRTLNTFYARIGEDGGLKGYHASTNGIASPGYAWYINGLLAPTLFVVRGKTYTFRVEGGNNPHKADFYHPLYITNDSFGGFIKYSEEERKKIKVYAGVDFDRKGRATPTTAGRLCAWISPHGSDRRKSDNFHSFIQYRSSLNYTCEEGKAAILSWTPNASTPDVVYYQSYMQRNMGWKIIVLDNFSNNNNGGNRSQCSKYTLLLFILGLLNFYNYT